MRAKLRLSSLYTSLTIALFLLFYLLKSSQQGRRDFVIGRLVTLVSLHPRQAHDLGYRGTLLRIVLHHSSDKKLEIVAWSVLTVGPGGLMTSPKLGCSVVDKAGIKIVLLLGNSEWRSTSHHNEQYVRR